MAEVLSFSINAGENKNYEMAGGYVEILETSGPLGIILYNNEGGITDVLKGVESGIFCAKTFKRFNVTSATAQNVKLFISDGSAGSRRQPGNVKVIDNTKEEVQSDKFFAGAMSVASINGFIRSGVFNTVGSGKKVAINVAEFASNSGNVFLTTVNSLQTNVSNCFLSKKVGVPQIIGVVGTWEEGQGLAPTGMVGNIMAWIGANLNIKREFRQPIVLNEGFGVVFTSNDAGKSMATNFEIEIF